MLFKRIAIVASFALTTLTSAVAAAGGGALEGRLMPRGRSRRCGRSAHAARARRADRFTRRAGPHGAPDRDARQSCRCGARADRRGRGRQREGCDPGSLYLYAGARGHLDILRMTLAHGADLRSTNRYRGTALIPAAERGHVDTVRTLIDAGVDVDHVNRLGWTALLEAIMLGDGSERYVRIVQLLVAGHANVNLADSNGETPLQHARQRGYGAIERVLVAAGRGRGGAGASVRRSGPYVPIEMKRLRPRGEVFQMGEAVCRSGRQLPRPPSQPAAGPRRG